MCCVSPAWLCRSVDLTSCWGTEANDRLLQGDLDGSLPPFKGAWHVILRSVGVNGLNGLVISPSCNQWAPKINDGGGQGPATSAVMTTCNRRIHMLVMQQRVGNAVTQLSKRQAVLPGWLRRRLLGKPGQRMRISTGPTDA